MDSTGIGTFSPIAIANIPAFDVLSHSSPRRRAWERFRTLFVIARSLRSLSWLNLLVGQMQTAFGGFLAVYLTSHGWSGTDIGLALTVGTVTVMVLQVPAGALVDAVHSKHFAAGVAILAIAASALMIGLWPSLWAVMFAEILHGGASCMLTPAIAAITLTLARADALGERLGENVQFAAIGSGVAAAVMGAIGYYFSHRVIFFLGAGCGVAALLALRAIHPGDVYAGPTRTPHPAAVPVRSRTGRPPPKRRVMLDRPLLIFAACMGLFQLGNAAVLPIAANAVTHTHGRAADLVIAAAIFVPQVLAAIFSPRMGRLAETWGRRPVLLLGLVALPVRALLLSTTSDPALIIAFQVLDGLSAAVLGLMVPLVVADLTRYAGRFNLAMSVVLLAIGVGASLSTLLAGVISDHLGDPAAFVALAMMGVAALLLAWQMLPETAPSLAVAQPA